MKDKYIELNQRRQLGDIINTYFDFFKLNLKSFTNIFISYNGIFIFLLLGISYLMVTGFIGLFKENDVFDSTTEMSSLMYLGISAVLFLIVFIIIAGLNYSLASSYMIRYDQNKTIINNKTEVWEMVKKNIGRIILFILSLGLIYFIYIIISMILSFIPLIGFVAQNVINFTITAWFGISFMVMLHEDKPIIDSFTEGWNLISTNFWKTIGANFILGLLLGMLFLLVLIIPGVIVGIYSYHAISTDVAIEDSIVAKVVYTFGLCVFLIIMTYSQSLSQFVSGILYFSLREEKYNIHMREKINQIGAGE